MTESGYQNLIIKNIEKRGGHVVNGIYSKSGEADLQCGIPVTFNHSKEVQYEWGTKWVDEKITRLLHIAVEVKTEKEYARLMKGLDGDYNVIDDKKLKLHEFVQMAKIRKVRRLGGLALVAWNYKQVEEYINETVS